jgi:hypothetical protein
MVPETPPLKSCWTGTHVSALLQLIPNSCLSCSDRASLCLSGAGESAGALSGDGWMLSWRGVWRTVRPKHFHLDGHEALLLRHRQTASCRAGSYFSKPVCAAKVCCRIRLSLRLTPYPLPLWIGESFRGSIDFIQAGRSVGGGH